MGIEIKVPEGWKHWVHNNAASINEYMFSKQFPEGLLWIQVTTEILFLEIPNYLDWSESDLKEVLQLCWKLCDECKRDAEKDNFFGDY